MGTLSSLTGGSGGGGSPLPQPEWLLGKSSYTYTFPYDGVVLVHVIGAGGSGAAQYNTYGATGGGAGGYSRKQFTVTSSTTATVTTGVGGAQAGQGVQQAAGNAGTNTTFVLGSDTLIGNGGGGGQRFGTANTVGQGGSASGGDVNYTGGDSGKLGANYNDRAIATGGGAVNLFNLNTNGGSNTNGAQWASTGGGGVGGRGGDIGNNAYKQSTGGGGSAGAADDIPNSSNTDGASANGGPAGVRLFTFTGPFLDGQGGNPIMHYNNTASTYGWGMSPVSGPIGIGAGSGGMLLWETNVQGSTMMRGQNAGIFGGSGGVFQGQHNGGSSGDAGLGGGSGAHIYYQSDSNPQRHSGRGGNGVVIIEYIERS